MTTDAEVDSDAKDRDGLGAIRTALDDLMASLSTQYHAPSEDHMRVGRILRCHLLVEHELREYIAHFNPNLGDLADENVSFDLLRRIALGMRGEAGIGAQLNKDLINLNRLRNKLSHRLDVQIEQLDCFRELEQRHRALCKGRAIEVEGHDVLTIVILGVTVSATCALRFIRVAHAEAQRLRADVARSEKQLLERSSELLDEIVRELAPEVDWPVPRVQGGSPD